MSTYKLTYFNVKARAEIIRLIFAAAGVEYEDVRIPRDQWPSLKSATPFGQIPILEVDGVTLCQSNAIARYLARKFNLAGKTELDQARGDMLVECFVDTLDPLVAFFRATDETKKAEAKKKYVEEQLPAYLTLLEGLLTANHGGNKFFVGDELTWVDLAFLNYVDWLKHATDEPLAKHPKLAALKERVTKLPRIAEWIVKRPESER